MHFYNASWTNLANYACINRSILASARPFTFMSFIPFQVWVPSEGTFASRSTYACFCIFVRPLLPSL